MKIIIHPTSEKALQATFASESHAVLLVGLPGVGLKTIATAYTQPIRTVVPQLLTKTTTIPQISIEQVRELYTLTRGKNSKLQTVVIDDADTMTLPAQNSFLKLLEEPPANTRFVLTSHLPDRLLPTIRSRLQTVTILPTNAANSLLDTLQDSTKRQQLSYIANGLPAELRRLLHDEQYFRAVAVQATLAKQLVESAPYERLVVLQKEKFDRKSALALLQRMLQFLARSRSDSVVERSTELLKSYEAIERGGNIRLHLARAMVY